MRTIAFGFFCLLAAVLSAGCSRSVSYDTDLQLKPLVQHKSDGALEPLAGAVSYAFPLADTTQWTVATYQDALDGVLTDKSTAERWSGGVRGGYLAADGRQTWLSMPVSTPSVLVTVADPLARQFGYGQFELAENLSPLTLTVVFYPWTQADAYKKNVWWMFNEDYVPPGESSLLINPQTQTEQQGTTEPLAGLKAFAFTGYSPDQWLPASYEDALNGILTRTGSTQTFGDGIAGRPLTEEERTNWLGLDVKDKTSLVVAVDTRNKLYAYAVLTPRADMEPTEVTLIFETWQESSQYVSGEWTVVNEFYVSPEQMLLQLDLNVERTEGAAAEPLLGGKAFAFAGADPATWLPASFEHAEQGILTNSETDQTRQNGVAGHPFAHEGKENWIGINPGASQTLVIAVDPENRLYAYAVLSVDTDNGPSVSRVVFQPWRTEAEYMSGQWIVIDEKNLPEEEGPSEPTYRLHAKRP